MEQIFSAIKANDTKTLAVLLSDYNGSKTGILCNALLTGTPEIMQILINKNFHYQGDVFRQNYDYKPDLVEMMFDNGYIPDFFPPAFINIKLFRIYVQYCDVNRMEKSKGKKPLISYLLLNHGKELTLRHLKLLDQHGLNWEVRDARKKTALYIACAVNNPELYDFIIERSSVQDNIMEHAIDKENISMIIKLVNHGYSLTHAHFVIMATRNTMSFVKFEAILNKFVETKSIFDDGAIILLKSIKPHFARIISRKIRLLLSYVDINAVYYGGTLLSHLLSIRFDAYSPLSDMHLVLKELFELIINNAKFNVTQNDLHFNSPIAVGLTNSNYEEVKTLIKRGFSIHINNLYNIVKSARIETSADIDMFKELITYNSNGILYGKLTREITITAILNRKYNIAMYAYVFLNEYISLKTLFSKYQMDLIKNKDIIITDDKIQLIKDAFSVTAATIRRINSIRRKIKDIRRLYFNSIFPLLRKGNLPDIKRVLFNLLQYTIYGKVVNLNSIYFPLGNEKIFVRTAVKLLINKI